jgi:hypothetical protein
VTDPDLRSDWTPATIAWGVTVSMIAATARWLRHRQPEEEKASEPLK